MSVRLEDQNDRLIVHNRTEKRGAISPELYQTIHDAVEQANKPQIRSIILTGGPFFCAGGDLTIIADRRKQPEPQRRENIKKLHDVIRALRTGPVPVIAAIEGGAAGAGLSIALATDLIVAAEGSQFTAAYVKAGLTPDGGLTHALTRLLPHQMAAEMCLLGKPVSAEKLADFGIITKLVASGEAFTTAQCLADELAKGPGKAQSRIKQLLHQAHDNSFSAQLDLEAQYMAEAQGTDEAEEGITAFLEKRKPVF